jgi:signal transduction histidine kinase
MLEKKVDLRTKELQESNTKLSESLSRVETLKEKIAARAAAEKEKLESELFQAQKLESIGLLAGGIAHNFNNRLGSVTSCANLILRKYGSDNPEVSRYVENIVHTCKNVTESTGKLLAFARKNKSDVMKVDIHEVIESVVKMLEVTLDRTIHLSTDCAAPRSRVIGNFMELQNVVMNLAVNARDAMPEGGKLKIATAEKELTAASAPLQVNNIAPGIFLEVSVADTGIGMDEETKQRIFEPFFTTKEPEKGTGLGLASVYGTVKNHNGIIEVDTVKGEGTTFTIYFPLADVRKT